VTFRSQVPIHAYPVVANINCPSTLDFGMVPIGQELEKSFSFSCDVPIQFEYKLSSLDANNDFTIAPMLGIIPAEGSVQVSVLFRPTRLYTSLQKVSRVAVRAALHSQFSLFSRAKDIRQPLSVRFQPFHCMSAHPFSRAIPSYVSSRCSCAATLCRPIPCQSHLRSVNPLLQPRSYPTSLV
jgi:hypothetical protein